MASPYHPALSSRMNRGAKSKQHPPSSAIAAAFSVEAYSTLEAESRAHLAAVAAAAFQRRRDIDEVEQGNEGDEDGEAAARAAEVRTRETGEEKEDGAVNFFHSIGASAPLHLVC